MEIEAKEEELEQRKDSNADGSESRSESAELEGDQPTLQEMDAMRALFDDRPFDQIEAPQKRSLQQSPPLAKRIEKEKEKEMEIETEKDAEEKESEPKSNVEPESKPKPKPKPKSQPQSKPNHESQSDSNSQSKPETKPDSESAPPSDSPIAKPRYFLYSGGTLDPDLRDAILHLGGNYLETQ